MKTRNNVYYDLELTEFIWVDENGIAYHFSSMLHLGKFCDSLQEQRDIKNYSLSKRFGFTVINNILADIIWYTHCETRGFLIKYNGESFTCKKDIILNGGILTKKN